MSRRLLALLLLLVDSLFCHSMHAQAVPIEPAPPQTPVTVGQPGSNSFNRYQLVPCPGAFAGDIPVHSCRYTGQQRSEDWVKDSFTDEAILISVGSGFYGFASAVISRKTNGTPPDFPNTTLGFAEQVRVSYLSAMGNGTAEFIVGSAMRNNPRHISCADDPRLGWTSSSDGITRIPCSGKSAWIKRPLHILADTLGTIPSTDDGVPINRLLHGWWPSLPRLVGAYAGAYSAYPWEPRTNNTFQQASKRAGITFVSPLLGSIINEFPQAGPWALHAVGTPFRFAVHSKKLPALSKRK